MNSLIIYALNEEKLLAAPLKFYLRPHYTGNVVDESFPDQCVFDDGAVNLITSPAWALG